jgi:nitrogen fixation/metabolism regulation signal transduction histidine kinase
VENYKKENVAQEEQIKDVEEKENFQYEVHILQHKLNEQANKTNGFKKKLRELKKTNSNLQVKYKALFLQDITAQHKQESKEKQDAKKKFHKNLLEKD